MDFLDEIIAEGAKQDPCFPALVDAGVRRRRLMRRLAVLREERGLSQAVLAKRMDTSQAMVARIESGSVDVRLSTLDRYAAALGKQVAWQLVDQETGSGFTVATG